MKNDAIKKARSKILVKGNSRIRGSEGGEKGEMVKGERGKSVAFNATLDKGLHQFKGGEKGDTLRK